MKCWENIFLADKLDLPLCQHYKLFQSYLRQSKKPRIYWQIYWPETQQHVRLRPEINLVFKTQFFFNHLKTITSVR